MNKDKCNQLVCLEVAYSWKECHYCDWNQCGPIKLSVNQQYWVLWAGWPQLQALTNPPNRANLFVWVDARCSLQGSSLVCSPGLCKLSKPAPGPSHTPWAVLHLLTWDMDFRLSSAARKMPASDTQRANSAPLKKLTRTTALWENCLSTLINFNSFRYFLFWHHNVIKTYVFFQGIGRERPPKIS